MIFQKPSEKIFFQNLALAGILFAFFFILPLKTPYLWVNQLLCLGLLIPTFYLFSLVLTPFLALLFLGILSGPMIMDWVSAEIFNGLDFFISWGLFFWCLRAGQKIFQNRSFQIIDFFLFLLAGLIFSYLFFWHNLPWQECVLFSFSFSFIFLPFFKKDLSIYWGFLFLIVASLFLVSLKQGFILGAVFLLIVVVWFLSERFLFKKISFSLLILILSFVIALLNHVYPFSTLLAGLLMGYFFLKEEEKFKKSVFVNPVISLLILLLLTSFQFSFALFWPVALLFFLVGVFLFFNFSKYQNNKNHIHYFALVLGLGYHKILNFTFFTFSLSALALFLFLTFFLKLKKD